MFPSDLETKELAEGLGLQTYYDEKVRLPEVQHHIRIRISVFVELTYLSQNMGPLPSGEARRYGDKNFKAMMYAKVRLWFS